MSESRKQDHIELTFKSQTNERENYGLVYEPMLASLNEKVDLRILLVKNLRLHFGSLA